MSSNWKADYRGYGIVLGRQMPANKAHFVITEPKDGDDVEIHHGYCPGVHPSDEEAWAVAYAAARAYIDGLPALG